ncbi:gallidermin/nisin family lantibiotic, partial [Staphylococcus argenteus]
MERVLDLDVQVKGNNNTNDSMGDERVTSHFLCSFG